MPVIVPLTSNEILLKTNVNYAHVESCANDGVAMATMTVRHSSIFNKYAILKLFSCCNRHHIHIDQLLTINFTDNTHTSRNNRHVRLLYVIKNLQMLKVIATTV